MARDPRTPMCAHSQPSSTGNIKHTHTSYVDWLWSYAIRDHANVGFRAEANCGSATNHNHICPTNGTNEVHQNPSNGLPRGNSRHNVDLAGVGSQFGATEEADYPQSVSDKDL